MTREEREEAIRCLSVHSSTNGSGLCTDEQHYEAKQMAIQLLSQEPCEDAISREWLKTAIHNFYYGLKHTPTEEDIQAYIDVAPPVTQKSAKWISVSERLPEDEQEILFSTKTGRVHSGKYHDDDSANQWYSHRDKCRAWNNVVKAWMPLPKPYKPQERVKK